MSRTRPHPTADPSVAAPSPSTRCKRKAHQIGDASRDASMAVDGMASERTLRRRSEGVVEKVIKDVGRRLARAAAITPVQSQRKAVEAVSKKPHTSTLSTIDAESTAIIDTTIDTSLTPPSRVNYRSKRFLTSGLYVPSHHYRLPLSHLHFTQPQPQPLSRRRSLTTKASTPCTTSLPTEYKGQFPPLPKHDMLDRMQEEVEFRIPFDIIHDWENGRLTNGVKPKPKKYQKITRNVYVGRSATKVDGQYAAICHCQPDTGCGERCLNRVMNYLCGKDCPSGDKCTNRSLASRQQAPYRVFFTGKRGFGLQATTTIKKGDFIMDYRGEVIHMNTFYKRIREVYAGRSDFYALSYDTDEVIDAGLRGNDARFINHSCGPNLEVHKYQTLGLGYDEFEVGFWASRDIAEGEELFYNYNFDSFTTIERPPNHPEFNASPLERRQRCYCGAENCSGWLGKKPDSNSTTVQPTAKPVTKRKTKAKVVAKIGKLEVIKKGLASLKAAAKRARVDTVKTIVLGKSDLTALKAMSTIRRLHKKKVIEEAPPKQSLKKTLARGASAFEGPPKKNEVATVPKRATKNSVELLLPKRSHKKKVIEEGPKRVHKKEKLSVNQPSTKTGNVTRRSHKKKVIEEAPKRLHTSTATGDLPKRSHKKKVIADEQSIPESPQPFRPSQRARTTLAQRVTEAKPSKATRPIQLATDSGPSLETPSASVVSLEILEGDGHGPQERLRTSSRLSRRPMSITAGSSIVEEFVVVPSLAMIDRSQSPAPRSGFSEVVYRHLAIDDPQTTSASYSTSSPPAYSSAEAQAMIEHSEVASVSTGSSSQEISANPLVLASGTAHLIVPTRLIVASVVTSISFNPGAWGEVDIKRQPSVQSNLLDVLESSTIPSKKLFNLTNTECDFRRKRRRSWTPRDFTPPPPPYSLHTPPGNNAPFLYTPPPVVTMAEGQDGNAAGYGPPQDGGSNGQGYGGEEAPSYSNQDQDGGGGLPSLGGGGGGNGGNDGDDPRRDEGNGDDDHSEPSDSEDDVDENGNPTRSRGGHKEAGPSLDEQAAQAAFGADQFSLEDYSRHPDLVALVAENLNENAARQRKKGKKSRRGRLTDVEEALARTIESASRQGIPQEDGGHDEDEDHLNEAERAVQKAARAAAKAERQRLRDDEDGSKRRRNKWVLPLDDAQIELERRKKKKGQRWLDAMKSLAAAKRVAAGIPESAQHDISESAPQQGLELDDSSDDDGSESDMTELEEHEGKDKAEDKTEGGKSDSKGEGADGDAPALPPKPKRIRKPRPPRRFKTTLTRLRPKLEAALTLVSQEEEDLALEQERKRRKKGQVWLDAMKALSRAKREAQQAQAEGRPVPEFVLPPTSLVPSGKRKSKKDRGETEETMGPGDESVEDENSAATAAEVAALLPPGDTAMASVEQLESEIPGGIPAFMFPPDHPAAQGHRTDASADASSTTLPDYLDPHLMANAAAAAAAFERSQTMSSGGVPTSTSFSAYMPQFPTAQANLTGGYGGGHESASTGQYNDADYRFDSNVYAQQAYQQDQSTSGQDVQSGDYQTTVQSFAGLPAFNLPVFDPFQRDDGLVGSPGSSTHQLANMPPVPILSRASETPTATGEKRKRGPPVKKIAGSTMVPLTDEQWEAERKKRKKGYNWVAETKAAAEAERQAAALRASGIKPPRKTKSNSRRTADALAATEQAAADQAQLQYDPSQVDMHQDQDQDHYGLALSLVDHGNHDDGSGADQHVPSDGIALQQQPHHDDVLPYPTMNESLIAGDQPYGGLQQAYQASGQPYGLDMQMYNAEEAANVYVGAAAEQIYHAIDPYQAMQHQGGD